MTNAYLSLREKEEAVAVPLFTRWVRIFRQEPLLY